MLHRRFPLREVFLLVALLPFLIASCGGAEESSTAETPSADAESPDVDVEVVEVQVEESTDTDVEEIDPNDLTEAGRVELKQYTVAYIGSGSMGDGTLTVNGKAYPFKIAGLGVGGIGVSALDATGTVYNLNDVSDFAGTYGNARLGATAGESGGGKLWLKNTNGVVIKLQTNMRGLAVTGGVDGVLIRWGKDDSVAGTVVGGAAEGTATVVEGAADGVKKTWKAVKKPFE